MVLTAQRQPQKPRVVPMLPRSDPAAMLFVLPSGKLDAIAQFCMEWKGMFIIGTCFAAYHILRPSFFEIVAMLSVCSIDTILLHQAHGVLLAQDLCSTVRLSFAMKVHSTPSFVRASAVWMRTAFGS